MPASQISMGLLVFRIRVFPTVGGALLTSQGPVVTFPNPDGTPNGFTGAGDLALTDTSQDASLIKPPAYPEVYDYGVVAVVPYVWVKGRNSLSFTGDPGDATWSRLINVTHAELLYAFGATVNANFLTFNTADRTIPVAIIGGNAASGARINALLDTGFGIQNSVSQFALNSTYSSSGVLMYHVVSGNQDVTYPSVMSSLANTTVYTSTPNFGAMNTSTVRWDTQAKRTQLRRLSR